MKKTLLLVFIHGFRGGDDTFGDFPSHLVTLLRQALPNLEVLAITYPRYETRGELKECVGRFRDWLQDQVIDLEVANGTSSPTVDPSVHVMLLGHSMGGIVGAETALLLASERPISSGSSENNGNAEAAPFFMFPHIQGLLAFDTPFLGVSPGVVSHNAEQHYKTVTTAYSTFNEMAGLFGLKKTKSTTTTTTTTSSSTTRPALAPATSSDDKSADAAATPSWQRWGRYAMFAGAAGAVAAGSAAAMYSQRERLIDGWAWVTSHLAFVGCLVRPGDLRQRVASLSSLRRDHGINSINFYTVLSSSPTSSSRSRDPSSLLHHIPRSQKRTFCHLPEDFDRNDQTLNSSTNGGEGLQWAPAMNEKARDEIMAHISMFTSKDNPSYRHLVHEAAETIVRWVDRGWYASTSANPPAESRDVDADDVVVVD
ncbi:hypothetical protein VTN31DRAFT_779 [Thermomyces dupontii]|uniref:uncharacterized protein n=1 Tax=Talaromyces thermophilus TaxID=28565 RepID=UPI003742FD14